MITDFKEKWLKLIMLILFLIGVSVIFNKQNTRNLTRAVILIPSMNTYEVQKYIEMEFSNVKGVKNCQVSLVTKTLMLIMNDREISEDDIENILKKWGCKPEKFSYSKLPETYI